MAYEEVLRPQYHFTPEKEWMNDPNGLVYDQGEYHLFFQHSPGSMVHGPTTWGHAVGTDLVHWEQIHHAALDEDDMGWIWSGSAVTDHQNTSGFQAGQNPPLIAFYTVGDTSSTPRKPCTQCIAYSNDRGRTWTKYDGNPVIGHIRAENRDPKVVWHASSGRWIMALFLHVNDYRLFASDDLKTWEPLQDLTLPGVSECPDLFELPVDGNLSDKRWVFWGANGGYIVGRFDGRFFTPETDVLHAETGANGYAAQTWSDIPPDDGRRVQISWMAGGKYPAMPFNQQMSFPVELTLRSMPDGIRLFRRPVREIELLHNKSRSWFNEARAEGSRLIIAEKGDLFDVRIGIKVNRKTVFEIEVQGHLLAYDAGQQTISGFGKSAPLRTIDDRVELQLLVDRTSLEIFGNNGEVSMSFCFLPEAANYPLALHSEEGSFQIRNLTVHELRSAWPV